MVSQLSAMVSSIHLSSELLVQQQALLSLKTVALWTIWNVRNKHMITNRLFHSREIINFFYTREVAKYISARWHVYLLRHVGQTRFEDELNCAKSKNYL